MYKDKKKEIYASAHTLLQLLNLMIILLSELRIYRAKVVQEVARRK